MNKFKRSDRVSSLIQREISNIIEIELRDRIIGMVTVTGVEVSRDLKNARVYVSVLCDKNDVEESIVLLNNASSYIRGRLGENIDLRNTPAIKFYYDSSTVNGMRMDKLLDEIKKEP